MNHLEEIRAKLSIEELVGSYLQLKKAGRNLKGLCPFHNDTKPSLMVSPEKGIAYCFACNNGGDIFKFIQLVEGVDFPEAVRILAQRTNVALPTFKPEERDQRMRLIEINKKASDFFVQQLEDSPKHKKYFTDRGLSDETIKKFSLGYAPDSYNALKDHLLKSGYSEAEMLKSGILNQRSIADKNTYDRFRHRYIFPIYDYQNNAVGFGGRIIGEGEPKYLNSPETPVYNKSMVLYGLNWAKKSIKQKDWAIFTEGYMDVISAHQAGSENTVATCGTALADGQVSKRPADQTHIKLIKRYTNNIAFAFDQDSAGLEATKRAIEIAQEQGMNIKIITIPEGKDPDECIKKSPEKWHEAIKNALPFMDFYFSYASKIHNPETLEGKKECMNLLFPLIKKCNTATEQDEYLKHLSYLLKTDLKILWDDFKNFSPQKSYHTKKNQTENASTKAIFMREEFLLGFLIENPELYQIVEKNLIDSIPFDIKTEKFYKAFKKVYNRLSVVDIVEVKKELGKEDCERLDIYSVLIEEYYPDFSDEAHKREIENLVNAINHKNIYNIQKEYEFKIRSADSSNDKIILLNQYNEILKLKTKII